MPSARTGLASLRRFFGAAWTTLDLGAGRISLLPPGRGGRHVVARVDRHAGDVVLKAPISARAGERHNAAREIFGLGALPAGLGPVLVAQASTRALIERATARGDFASALALDNVARFGGAPGVDLTGVLAMSVVAGASPALKPGVERVRMLTAAASTFAQIHARRPPRGPPLAVPSSAARVVALLSERRAALRAIGEGGAATLSRALSLARRRAEAAWRQGLDAEPDALCHGDLRCENLAWDGARVRVFDLEHAGVGAPTVDLALFAAREALDDHDELTLLDAYLQARVSRTARAAHAFIDRYFAMKPLVALCAALDQALELARMVRGVVVGARTAHAQLALRRVEVEGAVARAVELLGAPAPKAPLLSLPAHARGAASPPAGRRPSRSRAQVIAVDGHAASGKSEIARGLAHALGVPWVNTGAAYRAAAWMALALQLDPARPSDVKRLCKRLSSATLSFTDDGGVVANGVRHHGVLGTLAVDRTVALWAEHAPVRAALRPLLRAAVARGGVLEGRDVGTILAPRARHKLFITASLQQRAAFVANKEARVLTGRAARALLTARDARDEARTTAPLQRAPDAVVLDTTGLSAAAAVARALRIVGRA